MRSNIFLGAFESRDGVRCPGCTTQLQHVRWVTGSYICWCSYRVCISTNSFLLLLGRYKPNDVGNYESVVILTLQNLCTHLWSDWGNNTKLTLCSIIIHLGLQMYDSGPTYWFCVLYWFWDAYVLTHRDISCIWRTRRTQFWLYGYLYTSKCWDLSFNLSDKSLAEFHFQYPVDVAPVWWINTKVGARVLTYLFVSVPDLLLSTDHLRA